MIGETKQNSKINMTTLSLALTGSGKYTNDSLSMTMDSGLADVIRCHEDG